MKNSHTAMSEPNDRGAHDQLAACLRSLFGGCPELIGITFHEPDRLAGDAGAPDQDDDVLVIEMGFSTPVSSGRYEDVFTRVTTRIHDLVTEEPDVLDLLRGQTFARTLH